MVYYDYVGEYSSPEQQEKACKVYRDLAAGLRMSVRLVPLYPLLALFPFVPKREQVYLASDALIGLSNTIGQSNRYEKKTKYKQAIKESLLYAGGLWLACLERKPTTVGH